MWTTRCRRRRQVAASAGTLAEQSRSGAGVSLSLSGVADGTTVALTVADGLLSGAVELTVDVEARRFALTALQMVVSGTSFTLAVRAENALGELDVDYALAAAVTASAGTLVELSRFGSRVVLSLSGVAGWDDSDADGGGWPADGFRVSVTVDVVARRLALTAALVAVSGTSFALTVRAENAHDEVDTGYGLPTTAMVMASAGVLAVVSGTTSSLTLRMSGVVDGTTVALTVADGMLSATAVVSVDVVAMRLALSAPPTVVSGTSFALTVRGENAHGEVDTGYALPATATVSASAGTLAEQSRLGAGVALSLSGVADGASVALTVSDGMLLGSGGGVERWMWWRRAWR